MNEPEQNSPAPDELTDTIGALRRQVTSLLLAMIIVSGTLGVYLWYQSHITGKATDALRPQAIQITKVFEHNRPGMNKFVRQLIVYGQSHPDFQPVLKKFGIPLTLPAETNSPPKQ